MNKKLLPILLLAMVLLCLFLTACGPASQTPAADARTDAQTPAPTQTHRADAEAPPPTQTRPDADAETDADSQTETDAQADTGAAG